MKYKDYNDYELVSYVKEQIEEANEILIDKYMPLIVKEAKKYKVNGIDLKDIIQEGLFGLSNAIKTYSETSNVLFYTYAKKCIEASIYNLIKNSKRKKHTYLNEAISYDNDDINLENIISNNKTPLTKLLEDEDTLCFYDNSRKILSEFEYNVFKLKLKNYSYKEIADILDVEIKKVDNALLRIKNKLKSIKH